MIYLINKFDNMKDISGIACIVSHPKNRFKEY